MVAARPMNDDEIAHWLGVAEDPRDAPGWGPSLVETFVREQLGHLPKTYADPQDEPLEVEPIVLTRDAHFTSWPERPVVSNGFRVTITGPFTVPRGGLGWSVREGRRRTEQRLERRAVERLEHLLATTGLAGLGCRPLTDPRVPA